MPKEIILLICGVPWALIARLSAEMIFVGLTSYQDGSDSDREWLGRAAGWMVVVALAWFVVMFLVLIGSKVASDAYGPLKAWLLAGGAGLIVAFLGKSRRSPAKGRATTATGLSMNVMMAIVAPVFAAALIVGASALLDQVMFGKPLINTNDFRAYVAVGALPQCREVGRCPLPFWWRL